MKKKLVLLIVSLLSLASLTKLYSKSDNLIPINPIIGDIGYQKKHNALPTFNSDDYERIISHFEFIIDSLKNSPTKNLNKIQLNNREKHLNTLQKYLDRGIFPSNTYHDSRKPVFIDQDNTHCAVAYLLKEDNQNEVINEVQNLYNYNYIGDMNSELLINWIDRSGLTLNEVRMIQPSYPSGEGPGGHLFHPDYHKRATSKIDFSTIFITNNQNSLRKRKGKLYTNVTNARCDIERKGDVSFVRTSSNIDLKLNEIIKNIASNSKWEPGTAIIRDKEVPVRSTETIIISLCITDRHTIAYLDQRIKDSKGELNNIQIEECEYNPSEHKNVSYFIN